MKRRLKQSMHDRSKIQVSNIFSDSMLEKWNQIVLERYLHVYRFATSELQYTWNSLST